MLRGSPVDDLNILIWNIGNTDQSFTGTCLNSGPKKDIYPKRSGVKKPSDGTGVTELLVQSLILLDIS